jgi:hypothetical protein
MTNQIGIPFVAANVQTLMLHAVLALEFIERYPETVKELVMEVKHDCPPGTLEAIMQGAIYTVQQMQLLLEKTDEMAQQLAAAEASMLPKEKIN